VSSFKVSACSWLTRIHVSYEEEDTGIMTFENMCLHSSLGLGFRV